MRDLCLDRAARGGGAPGQMALQLPHAAGGGSAFERASTQGALGGTTGFYSDSSSEDGDAGSDSDDSDAGRGAGRKGGSKSKGGAKGLVKEPKVAANVAAAAAGGADYLDDDHRLLLRCSRPLLQSQNAGVVMAVGALHFYLAPVADLPKVLRSLVFVMRCKPESQHIMLKNICTMVSVQSSLFHVHFPCFFVHPADPLDVRGLKLEILTHIVTADNAATLLRELQAYLRSANYAFVALTIRAIGRCAAVMPQIASVCIRSLLELSLHPSEKVAGEAVVVIRALVQQNPKVGFHASTAGRGKFKPSVE
jgi:AP-3 complex subunit beta